MHFRHLFAATAMLLGATVATASASPSLRGTTLLNVANNTSFGIVEVDAIQHSFFTGSYGKPVYVGLIRPHSSVMVNFPNCYVDIRVLYKTRPGMPTRQHTTPNANVCASTTYVFGGSGW
jgi:hypothetical protein